MNDKMKQPTSHARRGFLTRAAVALGGAAALGVFGGAPALAITPALKFADIPGTGDIKVLNYALALEALEADLYAQALMRLTNGGTNALGRRINGLGLNPNAPDVFYLRQFGKVEREHRDFLIAALGNNSLLKKAPFNRAKFNFNIERLNRKQVGDLVYLAEKTGVGAYLGAIPRFATRTFLQVAGAIQGTEARHTAIIADVLNDLFNEGLNVAPLASQNNGIDQPIQPDTVLAAVSPFIVV
ncbi:MAG: ferritin-like domain-containing protein [Tepidisphaeraceae bacterium]